MKFCEGSPPQGPSGARRGSPVVSNRLPGINPPRGRPFGGGGVHPNVVCGTSLAPQIFSDGYRAGENSGNCVFFKNVAL